MRGLIPLLLAAGGSCFKITFSNKCNFDVWPAVGLAPSGRPDTKFSWGALAKSGQSVSVNVDDSFLGVRAWGRTGCDSNGSNCKTGRCNGGLTCTDAGITSGVIVSEYGFADFGQWGGERTSWDLSRVDLQINIDTQLVASDGQMVKCTTASCPRDQAYFASNDYGSDRNSDIGTAYTHVFCPTKDQTKFTPTSLAISSAPPPASTTPPQPSAPSIPNSVPSPSSTIAADLTSTTNNTSTSAATTGKKCKPLSRRRMASLVRRQL
ncbi:Osmotin, thaumatin-like protein, partial [Auriculariales sp. MPI-PUGE-AT-0066]